jgi:hypothetical protein
MPRSHARCRQRRRSRFAALERQPAARVLGVELRQVGKHVERMPAQKCLPVERISSTGMAPASSSCRTASHNVGKNAGVIVFSRCGWLNTSSATPLRSSCVRSKNSPIMLLHRGAQQAGASAPQTNSGKPRAEGAAATVYTAVHACPAHAR